MYNNNKYIIYNEEKKSNTIIYYTFIYKTMCIIMQVACMCMFVLFYGNKYVLLHFEVRIELLRLYVCMRDACVC